MSQLGWLIGWYVRDMWADLLYFLYVVFGSVCKTFASFQHIVTCRPIAGQRLGKHVPAETDSE
jgi:hypothetical protein